MRIEIIKKIQDEAGKGDRPIQIPLHLPVPDSMECPDEDDVSQVSRIIEIELA